MTKFKELGLNPDILKGLDDLGFSEPSPIQKKAIPFALESKKDLIALAQTGTGKTAAFSLPILNQVKPGEKKLETIIICPTRELCLQISEDLKKFAKYLKGFRVVPVYGGERIDFQIRALKYGANIVVGAPGRVHDLIRRKILKLQSIKWLVLDEADEMLDMGFKDDLDAILEQTSSNRQTLLFSATMSRKVRSIAQKYMTDAQEISAGEKNIGADKVSHEYYVVEYRDRFEALKRILDYIPGVYGILFCRTKNETQLVADKLKQAHYNTEALHGDISQDMRTKIMGRFKRKQVRLLVATDVAARGIDVSNLTHVINYNPADQNEAYTHRSGRTGRADKEGVSISILTPREVRIVNILENIIGKKFEYKRIPSADEICQKQINNFLAEIENTDIKEFQNIEHFQEFVDRLKKIKKEDLIKHFIAHKFSHLSSDYKNARDLNARPQSFAQRPVRKNILDNISLKINLGRNHGFDVKGLFALINTNKNIKGVQIGGINLMGEYSIFAVEKRRAEGVVRFLNGATFRGRKINIHQSNEATGCQRHRSPRPQKRFGGNRGGFRGRR